MIKQLPKYNVSFLPVFNGYALKMLEQAGIQYAELMRHQKGERVMHKLTVARVLETAKNDAETIHMYQSQAETWKRIARGGHRSDIEDLEVSLSKLRRANKDIIVMCAWILQKQASRKASSVAVPHDDSAKMAVCLE